MSANLKLQENQGHEGDALEGQRALQFNRIEDAVPGDGHGVESDNESNPESESECNVDPLSANSDNVVLRLITTAAPESQKQIDRLENALRELKKENQTLQDLLEKSNRFSDSLWFLDILDISMLQKDETLIFNLFSFLCLVESQQTTEVTGLTCPVWMLFVMIQPLACLCLQSDTSMPEWRQMSHRSPHWLT